MEAPTLRPGDRVRNRKSGDLGTIKSRAKLQVGPSVSEENPLWVVNYARLGALLHAVAVDVDGVGGATRCDPVGALIGGQPQGAALIRNARLHPVRFAIRGSSAATVPRIDARASRHGLTRRRRPTTLTRIHTSQVATACPRVGRRGGAAAPTGALVMARVRSGGGGGAAVALVLLGAGFLICLILAVLFSVQLADARESRREAEDELNRYVGSGLRSSQTVQSMLESGGGSVVGQLLESNEALRGIIGVSPDATLEITRQRVAQTAGEDAGALLPEIQTLRTELEAAQRRLAQEQQSLTEARERLAAAEEGQRPGLA